MLKQLLIGLSVAGLWASGQAASSEVAAVEKAWVQAVLTSDTAALDRLLADDLIYAHASGVVDTKSSYIEKIRGKRQQYKTMEPRKMTVHLYGTAAVTHAWVHVTGVNPQGPFDDKVMMMHTWTKTSSGWRLVGHQTTRVNELP